MADSRKIGQPNSDDMLASIKEQSNKRRLAPAAFIDEFIEHYVGGSISSHELDKIWAQLVAEYPWYCEDFLVCANLVLASGEPLSSFVCDAAQIEAEGGKVVTEITEARWQELGRIWLEDHVQRFQTEFDKQST